MASSDQAPSLTQLEAAYAAGDFAELRRLAQRICAQAGAEPELVAQTRGYQARVAIDPVAAWMLTFSALLFAGIVLHYVI